VCVNVNITINPDNMDSITVVIDNDPSLQRCSCFGNNKRASGLWEVLLL